jgi:hypothetical protein
LVERIEQCQSCYRTVRESRISFAPAISREGAPLWIEER